MMADGCDVDVGQVFRNMAVAECLDHMLSGIFNVNGFSCQD